MILHCSQKLAAKLPGVSPEPLKETSPLSSWHGHLYSVDRRQCVMFCHDATRYVLFMPGWRKAQFAELRGKWFRLLFTATLAQSGCPDVQIKRAELVLGPVHYDTATDRSVQGSLRIAQQDLNALLHRVPDVMDIDPVAASCHLNERPATVYGKLVWPDKAMLGAVARL
jgi:hypothetical protein